MNLDTVNCALPAPDINSNIAALFVALNSAMITTITRAPARQRTVQNLEDAA